MNTYYNFFLAFCTFLTFKISASEPTKQKRALTITESIAVGGLVGVAEVALPGQPLTYATNSIIAAKAQKARGLAQPMPKFHTAQIPSLIAKSYTGFGANATGQLPITAMQKVIQVKGSELVEKWQDAKLTAMQKTTISLAAGTGGAIIDTPSNAIQLFLQHPDNKGKTNLQAFRTLGTKSMRGFFPNAAFKEAPFTAGYQVLRPECETLTSQVVDDQYAQKVLGGATAGLITAIATQPGTVLRNRMQSDLGGKTTLQTAKHIYSHEGFKGFMTGLSARGPRVWIAVPLYGFYSDILTDKITE